MYRIPINWGSPELVLDVTHVRHTGWWGVWFGLDPTDAPLLLRDAGAYEIYSLTLDGEWRDQRTPFRMTSGWGAPFAMRPVGLLIPDPSFLFPCLYRTTRWHGASTDKFASLLCGEEIHLHR